MNLSQHFTREEFERSDTALRLGIDNTASEDVLRNGALAANGMELVREALGELPIFVHSWHRCEALERVLCAKDFAAWCGLHGKNAATAWPEYFARKGHPKGYSIDFTCPTFGTPAEIARFLVESGLKFDQLILEGTWVHISFDPKMRRQVLTAVFKEGTPSYSAGVPA